MNCFFLVAITAKEYFHSSYISKICQQIIFAQQLQIRGRKEHDVGKYSEGKKNTLRKTLGGENM